VQIIEPDAQEQLEPAADFLENLASRVGTSARWLDRAEERMELVKMELPQLVNILAGDGKAEPGGPNSRALAVRASVFDHDAIEPRFHPRIRLAALAVAAIAALDAPRDSAKADLSAQPFVVVSLRFRRRDEHDFLGIESTENRVPRCLGEFFPGRIE